MIEDKPYNAVFTKDGTVLGFGENSLEAERAAVKKMGNAFSMQELYLSGCYCKAITERDYTRLINKNNTDLSLFFKN